MMKKILIGLAVIVLLLGGGYIGVNLYVDSLLDKVEHEEVIEVEEAEIAEEVIEMVKERKVVNVALFGADHNDGQSDNAQARSDAMKIVSLDYDNKEIKITSVERDVVAYFPGEYQGYGHYNWAYWYGGPKLAVQTLNYNLDLDITQYVGFSFEALEQIVDLVGGVEIELTGAEIGQTNKPLGIYGPPGVYTLNGEQAMMYCRIRYIDSDFERMERQNRVIRAVIQKVKQSSITDLMNIASTMMPYIQTNMTNEEIKGYLVDLVTFDLSNIESFRAPSGQFDDICNAPGIGGYLVRSYSGMAEEVHQFIYGDDEYEASTTLLDNEKRTYATYGNFSK